MLGQRNMPEKMYIVWDDSEKDVDNHCWLVTDDAEKLCDMVPPPLWVGEYKLDHLLKVSEGKAQIEIIT